MTVGNITALRQTNIVRLLAYSSVAQAGFMLVPFAVVARADGGPQRLHRSASSRTCPVRGHEPRRLRLVIAVARKTRSGEISSLGGLWTYAPVWPPCSRSASCASPASRRSPAGTPSSRSSVRCSSTSAGRAPFSASCSPSTPSIAAAYYFSSCRRCSSHRCPTASTAARSASRRRSLGAVAISGVFTVVLGFIPGAVGELGDVARLFAG